MKIELDEKDAVAVQGTVVEMIKNLSPEKRDELVVKVMLEFLGSPDLERQAFDKANNNSRVYGYDRERLAKWRSTREQLMEALTQGAVAAFAGKVQDLVNGDQGLAAAFGKVRETVVAQFPDMVQRAMTAWFVGHMSTVTDLIGNSLGVERGYARAVEDLRTKLGLPPR